MTKTATFAIMHFSVAFAVAYLLTGSWVVGGAVAIVEPAINTLAFYFHEKIWKALESPPKASRSDSSLNSNLYPGAIRVANHAMGI